MVPILSALTQFLAEQPVLCEAFELYDAPLPPLAWMDDVCIPLLTKSSRDMDGIIV